MAGKLLTWH